MKLAVNLQNPLTVVELINSENQVVQKFNLMPNSSGLLSASDGSLIRVLNDTGVVEFVPIIAPNVVIMEADHAEKAHGEVEFTQPIAWIVYNASPQKFIL